MGATWLLSCVAEPPASLPPVVEPLGYGVVAFDWTWCPTPIPPVRDFREVCPASEIGVSIEPKHVCLLVVGLREWLDAVPLQPPQMEPGDAERITSITVCRARIGIPNEARDDRKSQQEYVFRTWIEADVPERPRLLGAAR